MLMEMIMQETATGNEDEEENERERNNEIEEKNGNEEKGRDSSDDSSSEVNRIKILLFILFLPTLNYILFQKKNLAEPIIIHYYRKLRLHKINANC